MTNEEKDKLHKAADEYAKRFNPWLYPYIMEVFVDGAEWQKEQTIDKTCEWIKYHNENGGCLFDNWEESFRKAMEE